MRTRLLIAGFLTIGLCVPSAPAQDRQVKVDPTQPWALVMKNGDWKWVKGLKRNGPMFEFYEKSGRHIKTERFVAMPAYLVDVDAVVDVNTSLAKLGAACIKSEPATFEVDLEGNSREIFIELATRAVFVGERGEEIKGCFLETPMGQAIVNEMKSRYERPPQPTPTPWPTPTLKEIEAAQAEFRARQPPETPSLRYSVVKTEPYSAWVGERFVDGVRVHVIPEDWEHVEDIAREIARSKYNRGVVVFFWSSVGDVGMQAAVFGVELIDGKVSERLIDQR